MRFVACAAVLFWATALTVVDIRQRRLPNALTLPGAALVVMVAVAYGRGPAALYGAVGLTALYLTVHLVAPGGLGAGDVKLAVGLGALTGAFGPDVWLLGAVGAPVLTAVFGVLGRTRTLPHGPSMCVASLAAAALAVF
ncbi:prepilin peptidase [Candidatus Mycolicibacterium alkanivorans]|uniref:A24 family peptidase n=1 Tax=Candidatus Mycolicibacterium alkanivorans TaxID=2954114 RepID=A0ABS9YY39_9MYCO|nr:A24 family peptidase [Candidatus Mycolicibacterium alkanivorans]MCI4676151.1 A24 family peptidase [Candidatus Mycolicibacterium alkanivorans]